MLWNCWDVTVSLRVLDLAHGTAGAYAALLFAMSGIAEVTRLAAPAPVTASRSPQVEEWLARGKTVRARRAVDWSGLVGDADIVVVDDDDDLSRVRRHGAPQLVVHLAGLPRGAANASELLVGAHCGVMSLTGSPGREPLIGVGHRIQYAAGVYAFVGALLDWLENAGAGTRTIEIPIAGAAVGFLDQFASIAAYSGTVTGRTGTSNSPSQPTGMYRCLDGYALIYTRLDGEWRRLAVAAGMADLLERDDLATGQLRLQNAHIIQARLDTWMAGLTRAEVLDIALRERVPCAPVDSYEEALEFWARLETAPDWSAGMMAGYPTPAAGSEPVVRDSALADIPPSRWKVVEMGGGWAGPLVGRILAAAGADVVKVESTTRWDPWRGSAAPDIAFERYPGFDPGADPVNRCSFFNTENRGKKSVAIDTKTDEGREQLRDLVASADVLISNMRPGSLDSMGLPPERLREVNPGLLTVSLSAVGPAYPGMVAWGPTMEALSGMCALLGYPDDEPQNTGLAIVDPLGGQWAMARLIAAVVRRDEARVIDVSLLGAALASFPEPALDPAWNTRLGNDDPYLSPHGVFRTAGDDSWIAIACQDDAQWARLVTEFGDDADARAGWGAGERIARRAEIAEWVSQHTAGVDRDELAARLTAAGVPNSPVRSIAEALDDTELWEQAIWSLTAHPSAGIQAYAELPLGNRPDRDARAPLLGEHDVTRVLADWHRES